MTLAVVLFAVLLFIIALVVWQHSRREGPQEVTFGISNAVEFINARLSDDVSKRLGDPGVRRIVEWEDFYLQGLAQENRWSPVETVAGAYEPAVEYIQGEILRSSGKTYSDTDIATVLALGVSYLQFIGAIGDEVGGIAE